MGSHALRRLEGIASRPCRVIAATATSNTKTTGATTVPTTAMRKRRIKASPASAILVQTVESEFRQSALDVLNQDLIGAVEIVPLEAFAQPRSGERGEGLRSYLGILFIELEALARRTQHLQQKFVFAAEHRF